MDNIRRIKPIRREKSVGGNRVKVSTLLKGFIILTILGLASAAAIYGSTITGVTDVNSTNIIFSPNFCNATTCKELSAWDTNTGGAGTGNITEVLADNGLTSYEAGGIVKLSAGTITADNITDPDVFAPNCGVSYYLKGDASINTCNNVNVTIDARVASHNYNATSINETGGGTVDYAGLVFIQIPKDGQSYNISEGSGADPLTTITNWTELTISNFDFVDFRIWYNAGVSNHDLEIGLYDYNLGSYEEEYGKIGSTSEFKRFTIQVLDSTDHITADGNVSLRIRHVQSGITSHDLYIDYLALVKGSATGVAATVTDHDALTGRDNNYTNHPWVNKGYLNNTDACAAGEIFEWGTGCKADAGGVGIAVELTNTGLGGRIDTNESFGVGFNVSNGSLIVGRGEFVFLGNESRIYHTTNNTIKIDENLNVTGNITTKELADCNAVGGDANGMLTCGTLNVVQNMTCRYPALDYDMPSAAWDNATDYYIIAPATSRYRILASGVIRATNVDTGGAGTGYKLQLTDNGVPYAYTLRSGWTKSYYWVPFNLEWTADITSGHNITLQAQYFWTGGYELLSNSTHSKPYICLIRLTT